MVAIIPVGACASYCGAAIRSCKREWVAWPAPSLSQQWHWPGVTGVSGWFESGPN